MLEQIAYLSEILAAIGVIISLVYVGRQLKLTNSTSRSMLRQSMSVLLTDLTMSVAASPELAAAVSKVLSEGRTRAELTSTERTQISGCYGAIIDRLYLAFEQRKDGLLTDEELEALYRPGNMWMTTPYLAEFWPIIKDSWPSDFTDWFDYRFQSSLENKIPFEKR
jgi:hypothetical protein